MEHDNHSYAKAHNEHLPGISVALGKFGSSRGLCQPTAEELSQDQESLKAQELLPFLAFTDSI